MTYADSLTVREARDQYFRNSGFDDRTYTDRWVKLPVLGMTLYLPNVEPRRRAVPLHDIDHILTEYKTDWLGEWQISSYELGTGCGKYWAGWLINMQAILVGAIRAPRSCIQAYARGRRSKGVYHFHSVQPLLDGSLGQLREQTTAPPGPATVLDGALFYSWVLFSLTIHILPLVIAAFALNQMSG